MELLGLSDTLAYNLIKRMTANGEIELSQSGRYAKYKIAKYSLTASLSAFLRSF